MDVRRGGVDCVKGIEVCVEAIPLIGVTRRISNFEVADPRSANGTYCSQRLDHCAHLGVSESLEDAGVHQVR
jgi:hypothetical protein